MKACHYNDSITGGCDFNDDTFEDRCYFNVDNFEDCYLIEGHEEEGYLNGGQGVYETPGAILEASTTSSWQKVWSELGIKAYYEVTSPTTCPS